MSALVTALVGALAGPAAAQDAGATEGGVPPVDVVEVSGLLDPVLVDFVERSVEQAERDGAQALLIQLNSKGAVVDDAVVVDLAERIATARVPVAVWVGPSGARAYGPSALLVGAAAQSGLSPGSRVGRVGALGDTGGWFPEAALERMQRGTVGVDEAVESGAVDVAAPVIGTMIIALDGLEYGGRTLRTAEVVQGDDGPKTQPAAQARFAKLELFPRLMHTVASAPVAYLLLLIGLALILFDFFTAGVGVAGVVGAASLILSSYGLGVLPVRGWALAVLVLAMLAFAVDVQTGVPRFWTAVGTGALVIGSLRLYDGLSISWVTLLVGIAGVLTMMLAGMPAMVRTRFATPTIGREWMIGEPGRAVAAVSPDGVVRVRDALWRARTNRATPIGPGDEIRVVSIDGTVLEVEPAEGGARDHRERR